MAFSYLNLSVVSLKLRNTSQKRINQSMTVPHADNYTTFLKLLTESDLPKHFPSILNQREALELKETPDPPTPPMWVMINTRYDLCYEGKDFINMAWCVYTRSCMNAMLIPLVEKSLWYVPEQGAAPDCLALGYTKGKIWDYWYPGNVWAFLNDESAALMPEVTGILAGNTSKSLKANAIA